MRVDLTAGQKNCGKSGLGHRAVVGRGPPGRRAVAGRGPAFSKTRHHNLAKHSQFDLRECKCIPHRGNKISRYHFLANLNFPWESLRQTIYHHQCSGQAYGDPNSWCNPSRVPQALRVFRYVLQADKFLKCDRLRPVVFKPNMKYLHVKISPVSMV